MAGPKIRLDHAGIAEVLRSEEVHTVIDGYADRTAGAALMDPATVRIDIDVDVDSYTTDRAAASVTLAHPAGVPVEAKYGVLTRAAAAAGLQVHGDAT